VAEFLQIIYVVGVFVLVAVNLFFFATIGAPKLTGLVQLYFLVILWPLVCVVVAVWVFVTWHPTGRALKRLLGVSEVKHG
jgi:hypothetical protein